MGILAQWDSNVLGLNSAGRLGWAGQGRAVGSNPIIKLLVTFISEK